MADPLSPEQLAILENQPDSVNPASDINFQLILPGNPNTQYFCQEVIIPGLTLPVVNQSTPSLNVPNPGTGLTFNKLTVTFLVNVTYSNYMEIQKWMRKISEPLGAKDSKYPQDKKDLFQDITIRVLDNFNNSNINFTFWRAFPIDLSSITLKTTDTGVKYVTATVDFAFFYYDSE